MQEIYREAKERDRRWHLRKQPVQLHGTRVYPAGWHDEARAACLVMRG